MCNCRGATRAGGKTASGKVITGFEVVYPKVLNREPETFKTRPEARAAMSAAGGGVITTKFR